MVPRPPPSVVRALTRALGDQLGTEQIRTDEDTLARCSGDWSGAEPVLPDVVVFPGDTAGVATTLAIAQAHRVPVTPRGLGSGKAGGAIPVAGGIVLSLERMDRIERIDEANLTVEVGAGAVLADLWRAVEARGLFYPPDPNSADISSIGGNIACNAGGPRALKYGVTRDYVLGLEVVLPNGNILEVGKATRKHVTGYDLCGLIVGSEGTLGVVTKATLRLLPKPAAVETALLGFDGVKTAAVALCQLLAEGHSPRTLELLDHHALDAIAAEGGAHFPPLARALVIAETDGPSPERALEALAHLCERAAELGAGEALIARDERQRREMWAPRSRLSEALRRSAHAKISEDIVVPRSKLAEMIDAAGQIAARHQVRVATYGHAGDGNLHVNVLMDEGQAEAGRAAVLDVLKTAIALGGTLSGEHGIGLTKRDFLPLEHGPAKLELQRALKRSFDPHGLLNPGKIFPDGSHT